MALFALNGTDVNVEDTGAPDGKPDAPAILFGHGLLFSGRMYAAQVEALRGDYRCITIDFRGQGLSKPAADGRYDMDTLTTDVVALIDQLGLETLHYVGLSMGGFVGMRLAARHPERLRSLTLLDTSAGPEDPEKVSQYRLLGNIYRWIGMRPLIGKVSQIMFGRSTLDGPRGDAVVAELVEIVGGAQRKGMRGAIAGVTDREPCEDLLSSITTPTLVIVGAEDVATPVAKSEVIASGIAGSRLEVVEGAGHSSTMEQPDVITALIRAHVDAH
ncbi:alpha/beta fold hydrolase [Aeromicrobium terrae]|uniref:Alpha/beta fold hydrolase n=1 Tax=Aeromicrobium terrae TaxID=2498846 RepID=A0A5C8NMC2_9ACTN|nr:alpha/beta fold hydrolase [Aeromicrobium terrae]TXL62338.1 alpha/beta fold hydrolase [Aeromicrobium terrae]